ncbi:MAG: J domain-containing protein [Fibrobacterota bacterium]
MKKAFREKIKDNHPDKALTSGFSAEILSDKFIRIKEAYETLLLFISNEKKTAALLDDPGAGRPASPCVDNEKPAGKWDFFYQGPIPKKRFRFGQYLYYHGKISWQEYMQSLLWQRKRRPVFGRLATEWGFLSGMDLLGILKSVRPSELLGETATRLEKLTPYQVFVLLGKQSSYCAKIGRFFVEAGIIGEEELAKHLRNFYSHNYSFG